LHIALQDGRISNGIDSLIDQPFVVLQGINNGPMRHASFPPSINTIRVGCSSLTS
jgi:hypothetical protein